VASDPLNDNGGSGSVAWHFTVNSADIAFLAPGQTLTQDYAVTVADISAAPPRIAIHGASPQNLTVNPGATLDIASAFWRLGDVRLVDLHAAARHFDRVYGAGG
jgi:hypothetical protein